MVQRACEPILSRKVDGVPVYHNTTQTLITATTLANSLQIAEGTPTAEGYHRVLTLIKDKALVQQNAPTSSRTHSVVEIFGTHPSRVPTDSNIASSTHPSHSPKAHQSKGVRDACDTINKSRPESTCRADGPPVGSVRLSWQ